MAMQKYLAMHQEPADHVMPLSASMAQGAGNVMTVGLPCWQADRLLPHYHCWGIDLEGQGDSPQGTQKAANIIDGFVDCILAVVSQLGCRGVAQSPPWDWCRACLETSDHVMLSSGHCIQASPLLATVGVSRRCF